ncbi:putative Rho protein GDP-dissociation inhibitor [Helianthus annuus]|uniref:Rho protein GDP-dissociation inhibitor n=1 Tax=Helianthus annuus TaxID=4232 RepID=A0A251VCV8_HELAN|nr:putative Rho protein GDP-dissociation inhibitor [Helianthus annuus]KAJ0950395.1 putative Rho protein GDP-dissociation inhibitor [Helianthus annuus]
MFTQVVFYRLWWLFEICLGSIVSPGRSDIILPILEHGKPESRWFILKEGCYNSLKFFFQVSHNIVAGLKYTNNVWKTGVRGPTPVAPPFTAPPNRPPTFSTQAQGMPQQQTSPFGAQPWQVQFQPFQRVNVKSQISSR